MSGVILSLKDNGYKIIHSRSSFITRDVDCWFLNIDTYTGTMHLWYSLPFCCVYCIVCCIVLQLIIVDAISIVCWVRFIIYYPTRLTSIRFLDCIRFRPFVCVVVVVIRNIVCLVRWIIYSILLMFLFCCVCIYSI